ncbi:MAG: hypothetical protein GY778_13540 [bacterium]|nr:hypothetical protein [bacterium]
MLMLHCDGYGCEAVTDRDHVRGWVWGMEDGTGDNARCFCPVCVRKGMAPPAVCSHYWCSVPDRDVERCTACGAERKKDSPVRHDQIQRWQAIEASAIEVVRVSHVVEDRDITGLHVEELEELHRRIEILRKALGETQKRKNAKNEAAGTARPTADR